MTIQHQLDQIEVNIEDAREAIKLMEMVQDLHHNPKFHRIVDEGYFVQEASRLVLALGDANLQSDEKQKELMDAIRGISAFRNYLGSIMQLGRTAENSLRADEQTREELLNEDLVNG